MAIKTDDNYKGIDLKGAYLKALVSIDVAIYADEDQRKDNNCLGNKSISLSDESMATIYQIIKNEAYPSATDLVD